MHDDAAREGQTAAPNLDDQVVNCGDVVNRSCARLIITLWPWWRLRAVCGSWTVEGEREPNWLMAFSISNFQWLLVSNFQTLPNITFFSGWSVSG